MAKPLTASEKKRKGARHIKLSLILGGGVSLGSFEAGVLTELFYVLEKLAQEKYPVKYTIDVITGGSAGGMTAALAARIMMHDYQAMKHELHDVWVEDVDISALMAAGNSPSALFTNTLQTKIAEDLIFSEKTYPLKATGKPEWAPDVLKIGFSLSNVVGYNESITFRFDSLDGDQRETTFSSGHFADFSKYTLDGEAVFSADHWKEIALAALASGTFPIVFGPMVLSRTPDQYPTADMASKVILAGNIPFIDGGLFNNEPLREAIHLSREQDGDSLTQLEEDRIFILIDPTANKSLINAKPPVDQSILQYGGRLLEIVWGQSQAQDLAGAQEVNDALEWRDDLVKRLKELVEKLTPKELAPVRDDVADLNQKIQTQQAVEKSEPAPIAKANANIAKQMNQIEEYHEDLLSDISKTSKQEQTADAQREMIKELIAAIDNVASLRGKVKITLDRITANADETVSDDFMAFAGFFNKDWREYDFRVGRAVAYRQLPRILGIEHYEPETLPLPGQEQPYIDASLIQGRSAKEIGIGLADRGLRVKFLKVTMKHVREMLKGQTVHKAWLFNWIGKLALRLIVRFEISRRLAL